jgi:chromosome partitioning protein
MPQTVIAVLSRKGGVGKTTITMNLAIASGNATILDTDPQASAADWGDRRDGQPPEVITCPPARIKPMLAKCHTDWVFIDTQPSNSDGPLQAAKEADICLVVTKPNQVDLDAIGSSLSIATLAGKPAFVVLNQVQPQAKVDEVITLLHSAGTGVVPVLLRNRVDFANSPITGQGVTEYSPSSKAAEEVQQLFRWLEQQ